MTKSPICAVGIFIQDGKVLLGLRNYTTQENMKMDVWTTPGGRCEEGEDLETTLRREVFEEVNIKNFEIKKEVGVVPGAKEGDILHVFLCSTEEEAILMEPEKFTEWKWFEIHEIPENFINQNLLKIIQEVGK